MKEFGKNKRINVTVTDDLLSKIDSYAKSVGVSRSSAVCVLCSEMLAQKEMLKLMSDVTNLSAEKKGAEGSKTQ